MHFLIRAIARLSLRKLHGLGFMLGWLAYALSPKFDVVGEVFGAVPTGATVDDKPADERVALLRR